MPSLIDYEDLCRAAFDNDAQAHEIPFEEVCKRLGVDATGLARCAEQRALRSVIFERGPKERARISHQAYTLTTSSESLADEEEKQMAKRAAVWMDGAACALRATINEE